jgi:hypothetical protein
VTYPLKKSVEGLAFFLTVITDPAVSSIVSIHGPTLAEAVLYIWRYNIEADDIELLNLKPPVLLIPSVVGVSNLKFSDSNPKLEPVAPCDPVAPVAPEGPPEGPVGPIGPGALKDKTPEASL